MSDSKLCELSAFLNFLSRELPGGDQEEPEQVYFTEQRTTERRLGQRKSARHLQVVEYSDNNNLKYEEGL